MLIRRDFWWPRLSNDIVRYVRSCETCVFTRSRSKADSGGVVEYTPPQHPNHRVHLDHFGPISGYHVLLCHCSFSKVTTAEVVRSTSSSINIEAFMKCWVQQYGPPSILVTDNGTCFKSGEWRQAMEGLGIEHRFSPPRRPQNNGSVERMVGSIKQVIRGLLEEGGDWKSHVATACMVYNHTPHSLTGVPPINLMRGWGGSPLISDHPNQDIPSIKEVEEIILRDSVSRSRRVSNRNLKVGDRVAIKVINPSTLGRRFTEGGVVVKLNRSSVWIEDEGEVWRKPVEEVRRLQG